MTGVEPVADDRPNVELRAGPTARHDVVLAFPYDAQIVNAVRGIPHRRFDWDTREWWAPADDWAGIHVAEVLTRFPELTPSDEVGRWLDGIERRWVGRVGAVRHDGRGWWSLHTRAGTVPEADARRRRAATSTICSSRSPRRPRRRCVSQRSARLDTGAERCLVAAEMGLDPPPSRLAMVGGVDGRALVLEVLWDAEAGVAFDAPAGRRAPPRPDRPVARPADRRVHRACTMSTSRPARRRCSPRCAPSTTTRPRRCALAGDRGRADRRRRRRRSAASSSRFSGSRVRYALRRPARIPGRRAGARQDRRGARRARGRRGVSGRRRLPGVAEAQLAARDPSAGCRTAASPSSTAARACRRQAEITILNYEIVAAHREELARRVPRALVVDESHYVKNPQAKRTHAVRRLAASVPSTGLRLALTGTPVMNHAEELIAQLRVLGRLEDFGSGARFARQFQGELSEERLHWHLRRRCFVRRLKSEVLPQLPAKRQVVVPVGARQRARVPPGREGRDRVAARAAARPVRAQRADRRARCAPSAWPS